MFYQSRVQSQVSHHPEEGSVGLDGVVGDGEEDAEHEAGQDGEEDAHVVSEADPATGVLQEHVDAALQYLLSLQPLFVDRLDPAGATDALVILLRAGGHKGHGLLVFRFLPQPPPRGQALEPLEGLPEGFLLGSLPGHGFLVILDIDGNAELIAFKDRHCGHFLLVHEVDIFLINVLGVDIIDSVAILLNLVI